MRLPHNMGLVKMASSDTEQTTTTTSKDTNSATHQGRYSLRSRKPSEPTTQPHENLDLKTSKSLASSTVNPNEDTNTQPSNLDISIPAGQPSKKRQRTAKGSRSIEDDKDGGKGQGGIDIISEKRISKNVRSPYHRYAGVPWGETPWPDFTSPSPVDCEKVYDYLSKQHAGGKLKYERPAKIPPPSLEVAGCGETQLLLDGFIRTMLSGATNMKNANSAIQSVVEFYGTVTKSIVIDGEEVTPVKDSIDWNKVRLGGVDEFKHRIHSGGLQNISSRAIIANLEKVYNCNAERTAAFREEKITGIPAVIPGADKLTQSQKDMEIWMFESNIISLEHLRGLTAEEAMNELVQFKGVAIKTAACLILFGLQEPCFAVDTHCFRIAQWLGWIPGDINDQSGRHKAFAHLNLRIPDHLKYGLHQLFIEHGQNCNRCKALTREGTKEWENCVCSLEDLLVRKKSAKNPPVNKHKATETDKSLHPLAEQMDSQIIDNTDMAEAMLNPEVDKKIMPSKQKKEEDDEYKPGKHQKGSRKTAGRKNVAPKEHTGKEDESTDADTS